MSLTHLLHLLVVLCIFPSCGYSDSKDVHIMWHLDATTIEKANSSDISVIQNAFDDALYALGERTTLENVSYEVANSCVVRNGDYASVKENAQKVAQSVHEKLLRDGLSVTGFEECVMQVSVQTKVWSPEVVFRYDYATSAQE